jgi:hypothetical protein
MFKKTFSLTSLLLMLIIILFLSCSVFAQSGTSIWRINKDGNTLYLGGSVHILRESDFPLPNEFNRAFEQSSILVLEADISRMEDMDVMIYLMSNMFLPEGQTLQSVLDPYTYMLLAQKCAEYGIPMEYMSNLKPSMAVNVLTIVAIQNFGFMQEGVDFYYYDLARSAGKPIDFLESVESQIDLLINMGDGYENEFVQYSLVDLDNMDSIDELVFEWRNGLSTYSEATLLSMNETWPVLYNALITDRNNTWMPQIEGYLTSGTTAFIIVGNLHLHGPDGLLQLLINSGYKVEQFR